jgi:hypothetical protein
MTWYHPVWTPPTDEEFKAGVAAVENAKDLGGQTEPERDYIDALATFFCTPGPAGTQPAGEGCPAAHEDRARRYTEAMARLHAKDPNEEETAAFYGLALLGSATPADPTFENQLKAGKLLDQVWRANRHHPGATHYLIHTFDHPSLAEQGLSAAKAYADSASSQRERRHAGQPQVGRRSDW